MIAQRAEEGQAAEIRAKMNSLVDEEIIRALYDASKAGVKVRNGDGRGAHGFRACAASDMLDATPNAWTVAEFLGHADLSSLRPYIRRRKLEEVRAAVDRRFAA